MEVELENATKIIDIILLDTRYFAKEDGKENILGNIQWNWLQNIIQNETNGELTLIVSPIQIMAVGRFGEENWGSLYKESQQKLFDLLIKYNSNKRVILISGDLHRGEMQKIKCINTDNNDERQDFYEITSSGLTHATFENEAYLLRQVTEIDDYLYDDGTNLCKYLGRNYGEINIEWDDLNEIINVNAAILDVNGDERCSLNVPLFDNDTNEYDIDEDGLYLWQYDGYKCYGGTKQSVISHAVFKKIIIYIILLMLPFVFCLHSFIKLSCLGCKCCRNCVNTKG